MPSQARSGPLRAHNEAHPWDVAKLMAEQGLLGIAMPEEDGGQGGTLMDAVLAIETVAMVCPRSADVVQAGNFGPVRTLSEYATKDQKDRYLSKILRGESLICVGMTEPEAEALQAFQDLSHYEGIIPALESAHALAHVTKIAPAMKKDGIILVDLSGRGDKDVASAARYVFGEELKF